MPSTLNIQNVKQAKKEADNGGSYFNCWGCTLFVLDELQELIWITQNQMTNFLETNTIKIKNGIWKKGDILALFNNPNKDDDWQWREEGLIHTATYLGRGKFFHKLGEQDAQITDLKGVLDCYPCDYSEHKRKITKAV